MCSGRVSWGIKVRFFAFSSFSLAGLIFLAGCGGGTSSGSGGTPPPQNPQLTVVLSGTGTVTSSPSGINCGTTCSASFVSNTQVTLTATAGNGFAFTGWSGGCSGTGTCAVTLTAATSVTATFNAVPSSTLTITMSGPGTGTVTSAPSGIDCPTTCSASFANDTQITLTAAPGNTFGFGGWSGGSCSGLSTCVLTLNAATTVNAAFGGSLQSINHIIFLAQENRSLDHYFGELRQYWKDNGYPDQSFDGLPQFNPASGQPPLQGPDPTNPGCNLADPYSPPLTPFGPYQDCVFDTTNQVQSFHLKTACLENPSPSWNESHVDWDYNDPTGNNTAALNGFVWTAGHDSRSYNPAGTNSQFMDTNGVRVMGYYDGDDLNYYYFMASNFATSDRWFSPVMSRTNPNREYLIGATSHGYAYPNGANSRDDGQIPSPIIFEELQNAGISWKIYVHPSHVPPNGSCKPDDTTPQCLYSVSYLHNFTYGQTIIQQYSQNIVPISQFYTDASNGTLPQVAQIEPASASGLDEHAADNDPQPGQLPCCSVQAGAAYVKTLIDAVMGTPSAPSPSWKDSVFFLTYDEFGGFYDHVSPQPAALLTDFESPVDLFLGPPTDKNGPDVCVNTTGPTCKFQYTGYRVPLIVVSPFTKKNFVSHETADYTAILKLIEERFNLSPLSARDAAQIDMASPTDPNQTFFDFVNVPWATPPTPPKQHTNLPCDLTPPTP